MRPALKESQELLVTLSERAVRPTALPSFQTWGPCLSPSAWRLAWWNQQGSLGLFGQAEERASCQAPHTEAGLAWWAGSPQPGPHPSGICLTQTSRHRGWLETGLWKRLFCSLLGTVPQLGPAHPIFPAHRETLPFLPWPQCPEPNPTDTGPKGTVRGAMALLSGLQGGLPGQESEHFHCCYSFCLCKFYLQQ